VLAGYLALLLAYGLGNTVQDFWLEQIVKRGLTSFELPMVLTPAVNWGWAAVLLLAIAVYLLAFRQLARSTRAPPTMAAQPVLYRANDLWLQRALDREGGRREGSWGRRRQRAPGSLHTFSEDSLRVA